MEQKKLTPTADLKMSKRASLLGAIFLMATSAIGPGFITQTATFTMQLGAAFAFGILASILIDFVVQLNIWRIVTLTRMRASDIANAAIPGSGYLLAILVIIGGLFFNIGNIGGTGLGLNAIFGLDPKIGGAISAIIFHRHLRFQTGWPRRRPVHHFRRYPDDRADALRCIRIRAAGR
ncbi:Mn2+/Fe2+ NRAMP family transporter [Agrobacterium tumefaciens]|nr:Mn2+/Fe2+ NRAMP family transporter [Agrobacterium tumefaciens]